MPEALMPEYILSLAVGSIVPTVCGIVIGFLVSRIKRLAKSHSEHEEAQNRERRVQLITLRLAIYDDHFDIDEKLEAYELYASGGGNHRTKKYMDNLLGMDVDDFIEHRKRKGQ